MKPIPTEAEIRVLKVAQCPSLSTASMLSYQVGCMGDKLLFRLVANSASGYFNKDWIPLASIVDVFDGLPEGKTITCFTLDSLYQKKSTNSPGFLLAVLKAEGLVVPDEERSYQIIHGRHQPASFNEQCQPGTSLPQKQKRPPLLEAV